MPELKQDVGTKKGPLVSVSCLKVKEWAKHDKSNRPLAQCCKECAGVCRQAFPLHSLDELITKAQVQHEVRAGLQEAMRVHRSGKPTFTPGSVASTCVQGYRLIYTYRFIISEKFQQLFGITLESSGVKPEELVDQHGKVISGVITIFDDTELPRLEVFSDVATSTSLQMQQADRQLRALQASEVHEFARAELAKTGPAGLRTISVFSK